MAPRSPTLAAHIRQLYTGGNWTTVNVQDTLADVDFSLAMDEHPGLNSIARLVIHMNYYVDIIVGALRGEGLHGRDADSWTIPLPQNQIDWLELRKSVLAKAEAFAIEVENLDDETLEGPFLDGKYGTVLRQVLGFLEHTHYHLGQIVVIKRVLAAVQT